MSSCDTNPNPGDPQALIADLQLEAPEVSGSLAHDLITRASTDFFKKSLVWRYVFEKLRVIPGQFIYELSNSGATRITRVIDIWQVANDGRECWIPNKSEIFRQYGTDEKSRGHQYWYSPKANTVIFNQDYNERSVMRISVALVPVAGVGDAELMDTWSEAIVNKALSYYFKRPDPKSKSGGAINTGLSRDHDARYREDLFRAQMVHTNDMPTGREPYSIYTDPRRGHQ